MILRDLKIATLVNGGAGMARNEDGVVFVDDVLPGERVDVRVERRKAGLTQGRLHRLIKTSPDRVTPPCPYVSACGGCNWQQIRYERQVFWKETILLDTLRRIAGFEPTLLPSLHGAPFHYRYRARLQIDGRGRIGFFEKRSRRVVPVDHCLVLTPTLDACLHALSALPEALRGLRQLRLAGDGRRTAAVGTGGRAAGPAKLRERAGLSSVGFARAAKDETSLEFETVGTTLRISPRSFFQANRDLNAALVDEVLRRIPSAGPVVDLFSGSGNFALPVALRGQPVNAVEGDRRAVAEGRENARRLGLGNLGFLRADTADMPDSVLEGAVAAVADPPRTGLPAGLTERLNRSGPSRIVYVSCDAATLARDLSRLAPRYRTDSVRLVDMFPQTSAIETIAELNRTEGGTRIS